MRRPLIQAIIAQYQQNPLKWTARVGLVFVSACLVVALVQVGLSWQQWPKLPSHPEVPTTANINASSPNVSMSEVKDWHLFGEVGTKKAPVDLETDEIKSDYLDAPTTSLSLRLKGVFTSEVKNRGSAVIAGDDSVDRAYAIGAELPGPAVLRDVFEDRTIIEYQGRLETLWLYEPTENKQNASQKPTRNKNARGKLVDNRQDQEMASILGQYREMLKQEPTQLVQAIRIKPEMKAGEMLGVRVFPGTKRKDFFKLGLRANDLVTSINDIKLNNPGNSLSLLNEVRDTKSLVIEVLRGDETLKLLYNVD